jgi:hypothetical protein
MGLEARTLLLGAAITSLCVEGSSLCRVYGLVGSMVGCIWLSIPLYFSARREVLTRTATANATKDGPPHHSSPVPRSDTQ